MIRGTHVSALMMGPHIMVKQNHPPHGLLRKSIRLSIAPPFREHTPVGLFHKISHQVPSLKRSTLQNTKLGTSPGHMSSGDFPDPS